MVGAVCAKILGHAALREARRLVRDFRFRYLENEDPYTASLSDDNFLMRVVAEMQIQERSLVTRHYRTAISVRTWGLFGASDFLGEHDRRLEAWERRRVPNALGFVAAKPPRNTLDGMFAYTEGDPYFVFRSDERSPVGLVEWGIEKTTGTVRLIVYRTPEPNTYVRFVDLTEQELHRLRGLLNGQGHRD